MNLDIDEFITPLREASLSLFEIYSELTRAGFTEDQALYLLTETMAINASNST